MKIQIRNSIFAGLFLTVFLGVYLFYESNTNIAIVICLFCIIVSPILFYYKLFSKIDYSIKFQNISKDLILYSGLANHYVGLVSVGGTLYLLGDKLIFQTNVINFMQRHEIVINLNEVDKIDFTTNLGFINNGLFIKKNNGQTEEFVVNNRKIWKEKIERHLKEVIVDF